MRNIYLLKDLSRRSGYSTHTLKYYLRLGLFEEIGRSPETSFRYFDDSTLKRLEKIKGLRARNFSLNKILEEFGKVNKYSKSKGRAFAMIKRRNILFPSFLVMMCLLGNFQNQELQADADAVSAAGLNVLVNSENDSKEKTGPDVIGGQETQTKKGSNTIKIVVTDTAAKIEEIKKIVQAFDQKEPEVLIEAKIAQIVLSDEYKMGVDWEAIVSDFHSLNFKNSLSVLSGAEKSGRLSIGTISTDDYAVLLEALDTVGKTNILSSPRVTTRNNQEAKILVGSTEPYVTTTPSAGPATTAQSVNFIEVGIKLFVTPMIHQDDFITMKIKPEVSSVTRNIATGDATAIPVVETSEAETTVSVKNGVTIVIGGLIKDEKIKSIKKIPVLGDLPWVGFAFRNQDQLIRKTELVIFLTPRIITGDVQTEEEDKAN